MAKLQEVIAQTFIERLSESGEVAPETMERLRQLLSAKKKLKVDDLVDVFLPPAGGDVK